jgi:hypothetical protein
MQIELLIPQSWNDSVLSRCLLVMKMVRLRLVMLDLLATMVWSTTTKAVHALGDRQLSMNYKQVT